MVDQHVVPLPSGWGVRSTTSRKVNKTFTKKSEALDYARQIAKEQNGSVFLMETDGKTTKVEDHHRATYPVEIESVLIDDEYKVREEDDN